MGQFRDCAKAPSEVEPSVLQTDGKIKVISDIRPSRSHKCLHVTQLDGPRCKPLIFIAISVDFGLFCHNIKYPFVIKSLPIC